MKEFPGQNRTANIAVAWSMPQMLGHWLWLILGTSWCTVKLVFGQTLSATRLFCYYHKSKRKEANP